MLRSVQQRLSVLIVDDHQMVREGLRSMLDDDGINSLAKLTAG